MRMGTEQKSNIGSDFHRNSFVPHLLSVAGALMRRFHRMLWEAVPTTAGRPHPSRQSFGTARRVLPPGAGSHLGSTLKPGGAVLTRGVFRRSGSVACVRTEASPIEMLRADLLSPPEAMSM